MNAYDEQIESFFTSPEEYEAFELATPDEKLHKLLISSVDKDIDHWNQDPWNLRQVDADNLKFFLGDQWETKAKGFVRGDNPEIDNRLFAGMRAILAYATGRLATPELGPSGEGDSARMNARNLSRVLYQHTMDEGGEDKVRAAVLNLLLRKRGYLKLRWDPYEGKFGDVVTEVVDPSDIVIDRLAKYRQDPGRIYHRITCTLDELINKYPKKSKDILNAFKVKKGVFTQLSQTLPYYEGWFTYLDNKGYPRQAVAAFLHGPSDLILEKLPNPNWIYTGDDQQDKLANVTNRPPKPFIRLSYLNLGLSAVDETSLFDQAKPEQKRLNKRQKQWQDNIDYVNGRWVADSNAMSQDVAKNLVNKGPKTVAMVDASQSGNDVKKAFANISATALPAEVYQSILDARNEIDVILGVPAIFRGAEPTTKATLGRDMMVNQQAGSLQDDLIKSVQRGMTDYYMVKLQMMNTYYTEDRSFQVKSPSGKYDFLTLSSETLDTGVKVGIVIDSNLPIQKDQIRQLATELLKTNKIDYLTAMEDMGLPNPEIRTERYMKSISDPVGYLQSIEQVVANNEAENAIQALIKGIEPEEPEEFTQEFLNHFNLFIASMRFRDLQQNDPEAVQRIVAYLMLAQHEAVQTVNLMGGLVDAAGMIPTPGPQLGTPTGQNSDQPGQNGQPSSPNTGSTAGNNQNQGQGDQPGGQKTFPTPTMGSMKKQERNQAEEETGQPLPA